MVTRRRPWTRRLLVAGMLLLGLPLLAMIGFRVWVAGSIPATGPLIVVSADTAWHARLELSTSTYETALARIGARFEMVRPDDGTPAEVLERASALLLAGGGAVDPEIYGGDPEAAILVDRDRDDFELALIEGALERDMPILGICRGIQILNVSHGGTLRNLRGEPDGGHRHGGSVKGNHVHGATIDETSRLHEIQPRKEREVNSFHGQAVDGLGPGLTAIAWADDGIVEGVERRDRSFVLAVQWHPEILQLGDPAELEVFEALREEAGEYDRRKQRER